MSVNRNLFKKKKKNFIKAAGKRKVSIVSHVREPSWMSSPVKRLRGVQPHLSSDCNSKRSPREDQPSRDESFHRTGRHNDKLF